MIVIIMSSLILLVPPGLADTKAEEGKILKNNLLAGQ